jgi:hypothetical protein
VVYSCRTVVMKFRDPTLPHQLSKILKVNRAADWLACLLRWHADAWLAFSPHELNACQHA